MMSTFQTGTFQNFKAISEFNFGPLNGITIAEGTTMAFDGTTLRMKGKEYACTEFSLALKAKFCVPVADNTTQTPRHESQVQVHSATSHGDQRETVKMGTAVEDEVVVGSVSGTKDRRKTAQDARDQVVTQPAAPSAPAAQHTGTLSVEDADRINAANIAKELDKPVTKGYIGGTRHNSGDEDDAGVRSVGAGGKYKLQVMDSHQGTVVGTVKKGANSAAVGAEGEATRKASADMTKVNAGTVEAGLQPQKVVEGIRGLEAKSAAVQTGIRNVGAQVQSGERGIMENPPKPMQTTTVITEGEDIRSVRGAGTGDVAEARGTDGESVADLLPDALVAEPPSSLLAAGGAVAARPAPPSTLPDPEAEIAAIAATWDKKRQWQKRVGEAVEFYGDWPEALAAICEMESPAVVKHIKSRLAKIAAEG